MIFRYDLARNVISISYSLRARFFLFYIFSKIRFCFQDRDEQTKLEMKHRQEEDDLYRKFSKHREEENRRIREEIQVINCK
jgi:hypothetical protein